jgi:hypothetical protein
MESVAASLERAIALVSPKGGAIGLVILIGFAGFRFLERWLEQARRADDESADDENEIGQ